MVATSDGSAKTIAEQMLSQLEADHLAAKSCLEYAKTTDDRLFGHLDSTCERLLDQLKSIVRDPKSLDAIKQGDQAKPAEQQAQASDLEQLKKRVQDQTAEIEGLRVKLEQRDAAHTAEIARLQELLKQSDDAHATEIATLQARQKDTVD